MIALLDRLLRWVIGAELFVIAWRTLRVIGNKQAETNQR